ncbi:hypothetical protein [Rhizobium sp. OAE497]|uniref:hypothetical protein n=1 Tax=Rhizobium sp. OAE497 TaxID=2663796 RepID=UPI0018F4B881
MMKPVLDPEIIPQKAERPDPGRVSETAHWAFSMRYWRQVDNFGIGGEEAGWFVSLFERISSLCAMTLEDFFRDTVLQASVRFHAINWQGKNVPLRRKDFDWVPEVYRDNPDDYPIYQFHVSRALGRVVGFFDEVGVFQVVLLDPNHNIQPSSYNDYEIRPTKAGACLYASVSIAADEYVSQCAATDCSMKTGLSRHLQKQIYRQTNGLMICHVAEDHYIRFQKLQEANSDFNLRDVIELGLMQYEADSG